MILLKIATKLLYCKIHITSLWWSFFFYFLSTLWKYINKVFVAVQNDFKSIDSIMRFTCQFKGQLFYLRNIVQKVTAGIKLYYVQHILKKRPPYCTYTEVTFSKCSIVFCIRNMLSELYKNCLYEFFSTFDTIIFSILYF